MDKEHYSNIEDFLLQKNKTVGEINHNGVVGPNIPTNTVYSSHKQVKEVKLEDFKVLKVIGRVGVASEKSVLLNIYQRMKLMQ